MALEFLGQFASNPLQTIRDIILGSQQTAATLRAPTDFGRTRQAIQQTRQAGAPQLNRPASTPTPQPQQTQTVGGGTGPGGITAGSYDAPSLTQDQRQWLWQAFGHSGEAPVGYGGENLNQPQQSAETAIAESINKQQEEFFSRAKEFDTRNPFAFDEALAKKSAEERFGPYYDQTLQDYITGIERRRSRSLEDETNILDELLESSTRFTRRTNQVYDLALEKARQGAAEAGLFFSGKRLREEGLTEVDRLERLGEFRERAARTEREARLGTRRTLADLSLEESLRRRDIGQARAFDIETEIGTLKRETEAKKAIAKQEFLGAAPGQTLDEFLRQRERSYQYLT